MLIQELHAAYHAAKAAFSAKTAEITDHETELQHAKDDLAALEAGVAAAFQSLNEGIETWKETPPEPVTTTVAAASIPVAASEMLGQEPTN
jgi:chromosome segregation ATPase